jgi:hypothetical protein
MNVLRVSIISRWAGNLAVALLLIAGSVIVGQRAVLRADEPNGEKPAAKSTGGTKNSLDDELLKGLSNDLLEGIDDLPKLKPEEKPAATTKHSGDGAKPAETKGAVTGQPLVDGEDLGQLGEEQNPLARISRQMREVEKRISNSQSGDETQKKQQAISDELAKLIEQLKKANQSSQKSGSGNSPSSQRSKVAQAGQKSGTQRQSDKPARESSNQTRHDELAKPDPAMIRERMKEAWGNLPERVREQMMQTSVDEFLPKYELLIEKYFQRLSEEENPNR